MSQQTKNQHTQDNRYVNQGAEPERSAGKNLSKGAKKSPSHATEDSSTQTSRREERAKITKP